jgi:hypothetical protein
MYESRHKPVLTPALFRRRVFIHVSFVSGLLAVSLYGGMLGYHTLAQMAWTDAFVNAAMLLGGMGPVGPDLPDAAAKIFAGCYALYCGLVFIAAGGLLLAPFVHRIMHKLHWDDKN